MLLQEIVNGSQDKRGPLLCQVPFTTIETQTLKRISQHIQLSLSGFLGFTQVLPLSTKINVGLLRRLVSRGSPRRLECINLSVSRKGSRSYKRFIFISLDVQYSLYFNGVSSRDRQQLFKVTSNRCLREKSNQICTLQVRGSKRRGLNIKDHDHILYFLLDLHQ